MLNVVMAGLVPAIHALLQTISQIIPFAIRPINQPDLPRARPVFHRLFALNGETNIVECLKIDETL